MKNIKNGKNIIPAGLSPWIYDGWIDNAFSEYVSLHLDWTRYIKEHPHHFITTTIPIADMSIWDNDGIQSPEDGIAEPPEDGEPDPDPDDSDDD